MNSASVDAKEESSLGLKFDFLKPKDTITMTVLHTGELSVEVPLISENVEICYPQKIDNINPPGKNNYDKRNDRAYQMAMVIFFIYIALLYFLNQMILPIVGDLAEYVVITQRLHFTFTLLIIGFASVKDNRM